MFSLALEACSEALVPQVAADFFSAVCRRTGQAWGPNADDKLFWYRPPKVHLLEFVILHLFVWLCFLGSGTYATQALRDIKKTPVPPKWFAASRLNKCVGVALLCCWLSQLFFKSIRPNPFVQVLWLLMPCHLITLLWVFVFLFCGRSWGDGRSVYWATLAADCHWSPSAAIISPDWGDHQHELEGYVFFIHHALLLVLPVYFAARYSLLPMTTQRLLHVTAVATFINVGPYTVCSYVSGLNINYMLYPPPKLMKSFPFTSLAYRFYVILILILLTVACHFFIDGAGRIAQRVWCTLRRKLHRPLTKR